MLRVIPFKTLEGGEVSC